MGIRRHADNLTAAAMWAVFHYYAQDSAGTRRAINGAAPLVPSLDHDRCRPVVATTSRPLRSHSTPRPTQFAGEWTITATLGLDGQDRGRASTAGTQPVARRDESRC